MITKTFYSRLILHSRMTLGSSVIMCLTEKMAVVFMIEDEDKRQVSKHPQIYFVLSNFIKVAIKFVKKDRVRNFKEVSLRFSHDSGTLIFTHKSSCGHRKSFNFLGFVQKICLLRSLLKQFI